MFTSYVFVYRATVLVTYKRLLKVASTYVTILSNLLELTYFDVCDIR